VPEQSELISICPSSAALQNITVTLSGPIPFAGAVLTSYQFTNRPGANLYLTTDVATAYNCSTQTGSLKSVAAGTPTVRANAAALRRHGSARTRFARRQRAAEARRHGAPASRARRRWTDASATSLQNTIAYAGAPIQSLTVSFLLANYAESTTLKWFVQPSLASPTVWYGPFPQVVNVHS
jgi:hypothetical protein